MDFFSTFTMIIKIQAVFLMFIVAMKLWYVDRTHQKTKIALSFERFAKYHVFKKALFFVMVTFLFGVASEVAELWQSMTLANIFAFLSIVGLVFFSYMLYKVSSYTYEKSYSNRILQAVSNTKEVIIPLVGGAVFARILFLSPTFSGTATGMVIAAPGASSIFDLILLVLAFSAVGMVVFRTVTK